MILETTYTTHLKHRVIKNTVFVKWQTRRLCLTGHDLKRIDEVRHKCESQGSVKVRITPGYPDTDQG